MAKKLIYGANGPEWVDAGDVSGFDGAEIHAGGGNDGIGGSYMADKLFGDDGNDQIFGNGGNDSLNGGAGNDSLYGGEGHDLLEDYAGVNVLDGGNGNDTIYASINNDTIMGGGGNDVIGAGLGNNVIYAGEGDDIVYANSGNDYVTGDGGNDYIDVSDGTNTIYGGTGNDTVKATGGNDYVTGDDGSDDINVGAGNDIVYAGSGNDVVDAGAGNDYVTGDSGNDVIDAGLGSDTVYAGDGDDRVVNSVVKGNGEVDTLDGMSGVDTLVLDVSRDTWFDAAFQADIAKYAAFLATPGSNWQTFQFSYTNTKAANLEGAVATAGGVELSLADDAVKAVDDKFQIDEDHDISGSVLGNDTVPDLVKSVKLLEGPAKGALIFNEDGTFTFKTNGAFEKLNNGEIETVKFKYQVTDADGDVGAAWGTIDVTGQNDAPNYVFKGSYQVSAGDYWGENPPVYSAKEAAAKIFGGSASDYVISIDSSKDPNSITGTGWYDGWGKPWSVFDDDFKQDASPAGYAEPYGDAWSAYVMDHVDYSKVNYVWEIA